MADVIEVKQASISALPTRFGQFAKNAFLTPKYNARNSILALLLGLAVAVVLVFAVFQAQGASLIRDIFVGDFLNANVAALWVDKVVALGIAGISVAVGLKTGLLNIGVSGQMLGGALVSLLILDQLRLDSLPGRAVIAAVFTIITAAAMNAFTGALRAYFRVNEVVTSIMINWVMVYISVFLRDRTLNSISLGATSAGAAAVLDYPDSFHYAQVLQDGTGADGAQNYWLLAGVGIALFAVVAVVSYLLIYKSTLGFKMRATGATASASAYAGFKSRQVMLISFVISGALAGLAGFVLYFLGSTSIEAPVFPANEGFQALSVALIGISNPIGIFFSAALFALLTGPIGGVALGGLPADSILVFTAVITYFVAAVNLFIYYHPIDRIRKWQQGKTARRLAIVQGAGGA